MKSNDNGLRVVHGGNGQAIDRFPNSRLQIAVAAIGLVALLAGGAHSLPQLDVDQANDAAVQPRAEMQFEPTPIDYFPYGTGGDADREKGAEARPDAAAQAEPAPFVYFPGQFVNQAREAEEHIQAF